MKSIAIKLSCGCAVILKSLNEGKLLPCSEHKKLVEEDDETLLEELIMEARHKFLERN